MGVQFLLFLGHSWRDGVCLWVGNHLQSQTTGGNDRSLSLCEYAGFLHCLLLSILDVPCKFTGYTIIEGLLPKPFVDCYVCTIHTNLEADPYLGYSIPFAKPVFRLSAQQVHLVPVL